MAKLSTLRTLIVGGGRQNMENIDIYILKIMPIGGIILSKMTYCDETS